MHSFLLSTKLRIPPQPQHGVSRARLIDALERDILHHKLVLLSAPAGYGKTTLLSQWAHATRFPVAWLSLSEDDNDLERFLRYLLAGWEAVQPGVRESPLGLLLEGMSPNREAVLSAFINVANDAPGQVVFVLDDYHLIEDSAIHDALAFLLDHLPPAIHFVLAGRVEPPLPLARYRARDEMREFGAEALHFWPEETGEFLNEMMGLDLSHDEVVRLQAQLEGWIAGLQLMALTRQQRLTAGDKLVVSGRHRFIADYLDEDVLAYQPEEIRRFLFQTSILDRLSGPLCDAVTGTEGGQEILETLERENLFLVPLDDRREWFRYHRLFADFLQEALKRYYPDQIIDLHRRASRWYLEHGLPEPAFRHAVEGNEVELVLRIFERYVQTKLMGGEFKALKRWLDSLPEEWLSDYPMISLGRTGFLLFTGQLDACVRYIDEVEQRLATVKEDDTRLQRAHVNTVRCSIACFQNDMARAETFADQAFQNLPGEDHFFRAIIYGSLGDTYRRNGRWEEAKGCYLKLLDFIHDPAFRLQSVHVFGALADLDLRQGRLRDAAGYWRKALAAIREWENWGRLPLPLIGWVYIRMGELLYEWNELAEAWDHLSRGLERAELGGDIRAMIAGYLIAGRLKLTQGDIEAAAEYLEQARPLVERSQFSHWIGRFQDFQLELWLAQGRLRAAVNWADEVLQNDAPEDRPENEMAHLALAHVLIVKGDASSLEQALAMLKGLRQAAEEEGRIGIQIEALALQALAHRQHDARTDAMTSLERALRLAEPEGYVRRFADYGLAMARLLQEARSRAVMPAYIETLLAAFSGDTSSPTPDQQALPEPLTGREKEILKLIAAGLTNREIAETLVISPETVKKHTGNIYGKLGVHSRTEAAARARELDLLDD